MRIKRFCKFFRFKSLLFAAVFGLLVLFPVFGFPALARLAPSGLGASRPYQGILSVWNVDTFEGGTYSRERLLGDFARDFEQQNKGIFVLVQGFSLEELEWQLGEGNRPDMISFGVGAGALVKDKLQKYSGKVSVREDIAAGGMLGGDCFALPWCMGGYGLFSTEKKSDTGGLLTGGQYNLPLAAYIKNNLSLPVSEGDFTQYTAYETFTKGYTQSLLGTQRDIYRLGLKADQGKIASLNFQPLGGYTDLVQYMGIFEGVEGSRLKSATDFLEYVTSDPAQKKLERLSMFSVSGLSLYGSGNLAQSEEVLSGSLRVLNVFTSLNTIDEYKRLCRLAMGGDQSAKKTINAL